MASPFVRLALVAAVLLCCLAPFAVGNLNPTYRDHVICVQNGVGVQWTVTNATYYPQFLPEAQSNLTDAPGYAGADFTAAVSSAIASAGSFPTTFTFVYPTTGLYAHDYATDPNFITVVKVISKYEPCPVAGVLVGSVHQGSSVLVGQYAYDDFAESANILYARNFLLMFVGLSLVCAAMYRYGQDNELRVNTNKDLQDEASTLGFSGLLNLLIGHKSKHDVLIRSQREKFQSQVNRIVAESEQLKALVSIKLCGGMGFVDAANTLLMAEVTERGSFETRQSKREDLMWEYLASITTIYTEIYDAGPDAEVDMVDGEGGISVALQDTLNLLDLIGEMNEKCAAERVRRTNIHARAPIIGPAVEKVVMNDETEQQAEEYFLGILEEATLVLRDTAASMNYADQEFREMLVKHRANNNEAGVLRAEQHHASLYGQYCGAVLDFLEEMQGRLEEAHDMLVEARAISTEQTDEAVDVVETQLEEVESKIDRSLFSGMSDDLADALKFFLGLAFEVHQPESYESEMDQLLEQAVSGTGEDAAATEALAGMAADREDLLEAQDAEEEQVKADLFSNLGTAHTETDAKTVTVAPQPAISADAAEALLRQLAEMNRLRLLREELIAQACAEFEKLIGDGLSQSQSIKDETASEIEAAQQALDSLQATQREEELADRRALDDEERELIEAEIGALRDVEEKYAGNKEKLEVHYQTSMSQANSQDEVVAFQQEYQQQLSELDAAKSAEQQASKARLATVHKDMRKKRKARKKALKLKQKRDAQAVQARLLKAQKEAQQQIASQDVQIDGDFTLATVMEDVYGDGKKRASARSRAMQKYHMQRRAQLKQEQKEQMSELRDGLQREFEDFKARFNRDFDEDTKQVVARRKVELQAARAQDDPTFDLEGELDKLRLARENLRAQKRSQLQSQLNARRNAEEKRLKNEHDEAYQKEMSEQAIESEQLELSVISKQETVWFEKIFSAGRNRSNGKLVIEAVMRKRHDMMKASLTRKRLRATTAKITATLNALFDRLSYERAEIERQRNAGRLTRVEADRKLAELEEKLDGDAVKKSVVELSHRKLKAAMRQLREQHNAEVQRVFRRHFPDEDFTAEIWTMDALDLEQIRASRDKEMERLERELQETKVAIAEQEDQFQVDMERAKEKRMREVAQARAKEQEARRRKFLANADTEAARQAKEREAEFARKRQQMAHLSEEEFQREMARFAEEKERMAREQHRKAAAARAAFEERLAEELASAQADEAEKFEQKVQSALDARQTDLEKRHARLARARERADFRRQDRLRQTLGVVKRLAGPVGRRRRRGAKLAVMKFRALFRANSSKLPRSLGGLLDSEHAEMEVNAGREEVPYLGDPRLKPKLDSIDRMLSSLLEVDDGQFGTPYRPLVDACEASIQPAQHLRRPQEIPPHEMSPKQHALMIFGNHVAWLLATRWEVPPIRVRVASQLPQVARPLLAAEDALAKSYHYMASSRDLYVHSARCESAGMFLYVVMHGVVRVVTGCGSDQAGGFQRLLHQAVQVLASELFFSKIRSHSGAVPDQIAAFARALNWQVGESRFLKAAEQVLADQARKQREAADRAADGAAAEGERKQPQEAVGVGDGALNDSSSSAEDLALMCRQVLVSQFFDGRVLSDAAGNWDDHTVGGVSAEPLQIEEVTAEAKGKGAQGKGSKALPPQRRAYTASGPGLGELDTRIRAYRKFVESGCLRSRLNESIGSYWTRAERNTSQNGANVGVPKPLASVEGVIRGPSVDPAGGLVRQRLMRLGHSLDTLHHQLLAVYRQLASAEEEMSEMRSFNSMTLGGGEEKSGAKAKTTSHGEEGSTLQDVGVGGAVLNRQLLDLCHQKELILRKIQLVEADVAAARAELRSSSMKAKSARS